MRFTRKAPERPEAGTERVVEHFAWWPVTLRKNWLYSRCWSSETRWLEPVKYVEKYTVGLYDYWEIDRFID